MSLRVIAGELGGRRIETPRGRTTRPTPARVREAWFSALAAHLEGATVVDLYAGAGALGFEALSRGARRATFVESGREATRALRRTTTALGLAERAEIRHQPVEEYLASLGRSGTIFDIAVADPPYRRDLAAGLVERFRRKPFAKILCVEHEPGVLDDVDADWRRRYGDTELSFLSD